jgi:hypothetical protein
MARNTAFIPATPPGEISKLINATHADDDAFKALVSQQQTLINAAYGNIAAAAAMVTRPVEVPSGPSAIEKEKERFLSMTVLLLSPQAGCVGTTAVPFWSSYARRVLRLFFGSLVASWTT